MVLQRSWGTPKFHESPSRTAPLSLTYQLISPTLCPAKLFQAKVKKKLVCDCVHFIQRTNAEELTAAIPYNLYFVGWKHQAIAP